MSTLGAGTVAAMVSGCLGFDDDDEDDGDDDPPDDGDDADDGDDDPDVDMADELTVWSLGTLPDGLEAVAENYNEETGDDVDFDIQELGYGELHDDQFSAIAAGSGGPDIGSYEGRWTNQLIGTDGIVDFGDRVDQDLEDAMVDWTWDMLSDDVGEGRYGLPIDIAPVVTFYNRNVYDDLGIDPDDIETYDDFIDYGEELPDDVHMMNIGTGVLEWQWEMLLRQQGGEAYDEEGNLMLDTDETARAADLVNELYDTGTAIDVEEFTEEWFTGVNEEQIATITSGAWMSGALAGDFAEMEGEWGIHAPPAVEAGGGRATVHGGSNLVVPSHHDEATIERAWDFMEYALSNEDQVMTIAEEAGVFPAHEGVYDDDWWEQEQEFFGGDSFEIIVDLAADIPTMRKVDDHREVYERMGDFMADYVAGNYDSGAEMAADAEEVIAGEIGRDIA